MNVYSLCYSLCQLLLFVAVAARAKDDGNDVATIDESSSLLHKGATPAAGEAKAWERGLLADDTLEKFGDDESMLDFMSEFTLDDQYRLLKSPKVSYAVLE